MNKGRKSFETTLMQAEQALADARDIRDLGSNPKYVLRRAYYSMMYGMLSLFDKDNLELDSSDHAEAISLFNEKYVLTGQVDSNHYKLLNDVYHINENSDQMEKIDSYLIGPKLADNSILGATHFLKLVKSRLSITH